MFFPFLLAYFVFFLFCFLYRHDGNYHAANNREHETPVVDELASDTDLTSSGDSTDRSRSVIVVDHREGVDDDEWHNGGRGRHDGGDAAKEAADAEGDAEVAGERDHTAHVHESGHRVLQKGQHHHQRARVRSQPRGPDIQNARGHDKALAPEVVLRRSRGQLPLEGK